MSLRSLILHNVWLKLFALLLAAMVWFLIHFWIESGHPQTQSSINNPAAPQFFRLTVRVLTQPDDPRIFKVDPGQVIVQLTGDAAVMRNLSLKNLSAFVDLARIRSARETNQLVKLDVPGGVALLEVVPRTVNIEQIFPQKPLK